MSEAERILNELEKGIINRGNSMENFKRLVKMMHKSFPNGRISEKAMKEIIVTAEDRKFLAKSKFFFREKSGEGYNYNLGPSALSLVSSWRSEELTEDMKKLTDKILTLTIILTMVGFGQLILVWLQLRTLG